VAEAPAPIRSRDYSTPRASEYSRPPSRSGSFISFMEYSGAKNYEMSRNSSRSNIYDNGPLYKSDSRSKVDAFYGAGRLSRVDSYVNDINTKYEYNMPSSYGTYRSSSRSNMANGYTSPMTQSVYEPRKTYRDTVSPSYMRSVYEPVRYAPYTPSYYGRPHRSPSSTTLSRLYSGFTRDWSGRF